MSAEHYERAKKLGEKEAHARLQKNESPYLPVLDDILEGVTIDARVSLGLVDVPLDRIVGTATAGRTSAFAANFMPLLGEGTEFATKWGHLYDSMASDGLREPPILLEYLNRFYVVEGNKRVSVSKFLGGLTVEATVTRYVPRRSDEKENRIYYEFLQFYGATRVNFLWFEEVGRFPQLALHFGYQPGAEWKQDDVQDLRAAYYRWAEVYRQITGATQVLPPADAMLLYLDFFRKESLVKSTKTELKENISKLRKEFAARAANPSLSMMPQEESGWKLTDLFKSTPTQVKAAFLYDSSVSDSGWDYAHEMGRQHLEEVFGDRVQTAIREHIPPHKAVEAVQALMEEGYDTFFLTSPIYMYAISNLAIDNPKLRFLVCSPYTVYANIRSYYLRMFEVKYLLGMIAGAVTRDGRVGYVADYPIRGTLASINAFTLGVQAVNPDAEVFLTWSCLKDDTPGDFFIREGITTICNRDLSAPSSGSRHFGLYQMEGLDQINLAMPLWNWGILYESLVNSILRGQWNELTDGAQTLNYWWGLSSGAIDIALSRNVPPGTKNIVGAVRDQLQANRFNPFRGPIYDQEGQLRSDVSDMLPPRDVNNMDFLCRGIIGHIPVRDELKPEAQPIVSFLGLEDVITPASLSYGRIRHEQYLREHAHEIEARLRAQGEEARADQVREQARRISAGEDPT